MKARQTADHYRAANEQAAKLVLQDVQRYGGPDSLMVVWAHLVLAKMAPTVHGPLFERRAA
ncbi:MAG: hypothetical protein ABSG26_04100 [Bryobacteraceae bacterium]|jgi:hypothetical protein